MSPLTLTLRQPLTEPVDVAALRFPPPEPDPASRIARTRIRVGGQWRETGEVFAVSGEDRQRVMIVSEGARLHGLGTGMAGGHLTLHGNAGDYLAHGMTAGTLRVEGDCGDFAAPGLVDGVVDVGGDAGDSLAGAIPGEMSGARGGLVVVRGSAGARAGDRMRRGVVLVAGDAGDYPGSRLRAGSLILLGAVGREPGFGMKRGTVVLARPPDTLPATLNHSGSHELLFLRLLARFVEQRLGPTTPPLMDLSPMQRWVGDRAHDGRGEILVPDR